MNFENKKSLLLLGFEHTITKFCDETLNQLRYPAPSGVISTRADDSI